MDVLWLVGYSTGGKEMPRYASVTEEREVSQQSVHLADRSAVRMVVGRSFELVVMVS